MKLLIVDDQMSVHKFLRKMIDWPALGIYEIKHAYNGQEAVELIQSFRPELLVIDIHMPITDGIEALKRMKQLAVKPKTVILSAYDTFDYAREALRLSVSHYLLKPIDAGLLTDILLELAAEARADALAVVTEGMESLANLEQPADRQMIILQDGFTALGIKGFAIVTVTGMAPSKGSEIQVQEWISQGMIRIPVRTRSSREMLFLIGLHDGKAEGSLYDLCAEQLAHWRLHLSSSISMGISGPDCSAAAIPRLILESRRAAMTGFYRPEVVHRYDGTAFADGEIRLHLRRLEQAFDEKTQDGYSAESLGQELRSMFRILREQEVEPALAYQTCHRFLQSLTRLPSASSQSQADRTPPLTEWMQRFNTLGEIERELFARLAESQTESDNVLTKVQEAVRKIKGYIDTHCEADLSLQSVADRFKTDKYQISRTFKQQFGENYWQYVTRVRMEKAAELLMETDWKNAVIAERTGFLGGSHFSRSFKKHFSTTPKEFRACRMKPQ
ncbi:response regulator [Paenibacillus solisilvae]|uniref:Response regulator n=1 Tax=Paenibacillus solisilvae TaxID=2486751 RepID=A0ABW0W669_9BACL